MSDAVESDLFKLVEAYQEAFNTNDAAAMSALFTEDTIFVNFSGKIVRGRAELKIAQEYVFRPGGPLENISVNYSIESVTRVEHNIALVHARQRALLDNGRLVDRERDDMHSVLTLLVVSSGDNWLVKSGQNTPVRYGD